MSANYQDFNGVRFSESSSGPFTFQDIDGNRVSFYPNGVINGLLTNSALAATANTTALQAALTAAGNTNGPLSIIFPEGDIYLNAGSLLANAGYATQYAAGTAGNVLVPPRLVGAGRGRTRLRFVGSGVGIKFYAPRASGYSQMWASRISGISFYGPGDLTDTASCALQFGGVDSTGSNIMEDGYFDDLHFSGWYSSTRHDDCTNYRFEKCYFENSVVGSELAYNCDSFTHRDCWYGDQAMPTDWSGTTSSGTANITGISTSVTAVMKKGMYVIGAGIPANTTIATVGSTSITISNNATASATVTLNCALLISIFCSGSSAENAVATGVTAWVPNYNTGGGNQNNVMLDGCIGSRIKEMLYALPASAGSLMLQNTHTERGYQLVRFGNSTSNVAPKSLRVINHHFSQPKTHYYGGVVECQSASGNGPYVEMVDCRTDSSGAGNLPQVPWLYLPSSYSGHRVTWKRNALPWDSGVGTLFGPLSVTGVMADFIQPGDTLEIGTPQAGGYIAARTVSTTVNSDFVGLDGMNITLTGNITINNPPSADAVTGRLLHFLFIQDGTGGRTITWDTKFKAAAGTSLGTTSSGTASQKGSITFRFDGTNYRALDAIAWV